MSIIKKEMSFATFFSINNLFSCVVFVHTNFQPSNDKASIIYFSFFLSFGHFILIFFSKAQIIKKKMKTFQNVFISNFINENNLT